MYRPIFKNIILGIIATILTVPGAFVAVFIGEAFSWINEVWFGLDGLIATYSPPVFGGLFCGGFISYVLKRWIDYDFLKTFIFSASIMPFLGLLVAILLPFISNNNFHIVGALQAIFMIVGLASIAQVD